MCENFYKKYYYFMFIVAILRKINVSPIQVTQIFKYIPLIKVMTICRQLSKLSLKICIHSMSYSNESCNKHLCFKVAPSLCIYI